MRRYEMIFILRPSLGEEQISTVIDYAQKIITDENGTVVDLNRWGMKKLAYPIKKELQGYYVYCDFASMPAAVAEIERRFRIDDAVLKYLTIKLADAITAEEVEAAISETAQRNEAAAEAAKAEETDASAEEASSEADAGGAEKAKTESEA